MVQTVHSFWSDIAPPQTQPRLEGQVTCDVAVVGGGVNGLSVAYHLKRAGADVVLVEREAVGARASTKNFGVMTSAGHYQGYSALERRSLGRYAEKSLDAVREMIEREGIDCGLRRKRYWYIARSKASRKMLIAEAKELKSQGYDCEFVEPDSLYLDRYPSQGGMSISQYAVNPYEYIEGMKHSLLRMGVQIFEGSSVKALTDGAHATVVTEAGRVVARKAVVTVNGYTEALGLDTTGYSLPLHIFAIGTKPLAPHVIASIGRFDDETASDKGPRIEAERLYWQRRRPDGSMLFGGGGGRVPEHNILELPLSQERARGLVEELKRRYPLITDDDIRCFWGGTMTAPAGEKPTVAPLPGSKSLILVQMCYGHGMGPGAGVGRLVLELIKPGSITDPDGLAYLQFCGTGASLSSRVEGAAMRLAAKGPLRSAVNRIIGGA